MMPYKTSHQQYTGRSEEFRATFNNYRCAHLNYCKYRKVKQEAYGEGYQGVRLIDQSDNTEDLRKEESFWQYELDTFQPNGLNEREVALF